MENENENKILENWATITSDKKQKKEIVVDENQNKLDCKIWSLEKENGIFSASWLSFLKLPMPIDIYKKILMKLDSHILPHMSNTLLLSDFLTESYNQGGLVSIMSLNSLFILITRDGLEYPNFFNQLYSLLTPSIFFVKYRAKFFELLDKCLTSSHLPSYLIASFVKKLSRLSLTAPPHGVIVSLVFLHNCVRRHPSIGCLMHKIGDRKKTNQIKSKDEENEKKKNNKNEKNENGENSKRIEDENKDENGIEDESKDEKKDESKIEEEKKDETKIEEEKKDESKIEDENDGLNEQITNELSSNKINDKIGCDPFIWDETDVAKTNAIDSSLWEIETLKKHYCPAVSKFVSSFLETDLTQKTKTNEWVVSDFVFASYNTIISEELGKKLKQVPLAFYKNVPQTLFSKEDTFFKYGPKTNIDVFAGWAFAGETVTSEIQKDKSVIPYNQIGETREIKTESENRDEKVELVEKMEDGGSGDGEEEDAVEEEKEKMVAEKKGVVRVKRKREKNAGDLKKKSKINKAENFSRTSCFISVMNRIDSSSIFSDNTILSAAICSHAAYAIDSGDVEACLREWTHFSPYTSEIVSSFHRLLVSKSVRNDYPSFLIVHTSDTTFVAFCGPMCSAIPVEDISELLDSNYCPKDLKEMGGYSLRVNAFDHIPLPCLTQGLDSRRIIFCGHSMGGTIAHSVQLQYFLRVLLPLQESKPDKSFEFSIPCSIYSIGFGSPHFCDDIVSGWLKKAGLAKRFITVVNGDDPVPSLFENLKLPVKSKHKATKSKKSYDSPRIFLGLSPWMNTFEIREKKSVQKLITDFKKMQKTFHYIHPSKKHKRNYFVSAGLFIQLEKLTNDFSSNLSENTVQITEHSLHQHMLLGPLGYASQIMQNLLLHSMEEEALKPWDEFDKLDGQNVKKCAIPLIMQPQPFILTAVMDSLYEGGRPIITLQGRNLFFLLKNPIVYRESSPTHDLMSLGNWKVIGYSNAGTSLKIVLDSSFDEVDLGSCDKLEVNVITAFGSSSQAITCNEYKEEDERFMGSNMWLRCVDTLSELRKNPSLNKEMSKAIEKCLYSLFVISRVDEMDMDGRLFDIESLSKLTDSEFNFLIDPLGFEVMFYLGKQWAFEMEQSSIKTWASDSGYLQFQDGEFTEVLEGMGSIDVAPMKLISHLSNEMYVQGYSNANVMRQFSRCKILVLLYTFIANSTSLPLSEFILLNDAEKEAELVAIAMENDLEDFFNGIVSEESLKASAVRTVTSNSYSIFALDGNIFTQVEAMRRVRVLVEVYRLYSLLGINE